MSPHNQKMPSLWQASMRQVCPRCGNARLFAGQGIAHYTTPVLVCAGCGLDLREHDSGDGPAVFLIFILGFSVVPLCLLLEMVMHPPFIVTILLGSVMILAGTIWMLRPAKALTIALQYRTRLRTGGG